jgi:hypothetical protein
MRTRHALLVVLAAVVTLTSVAAAGPAATKQRVQIDTRQAGGGFVFVLIPLQSRAIERDSGTGGGCDSEPSKREILRNGQTGWVWTCTLTFAGKQGKLVLRSRYTWIEAGGPYNVATGTWKVVSGTGQYAHLAGGGRSARFGTTRIERVRYQGFLVSR